MSITDSNMPTITEEEVNLNSNTTKTLRYQNIKDHSSISGNQSCAENITLNYD